MIDLRWPVGLALLLAIPAALGGYLWATRRGRAALRFSSLALVREALPGGSRMRRHAPFALFLLGLAALPLALARPEAVLALPTRHTTILFAIDVSASMCANDIVPTRLDAAKAAAKAFLDRQPDDAQVGIVAFSGSAALVQPPTSDRRALADAIDQLRVGEQTAIGSGILAAIDAIAAIDPAVAPTVAVGGGSGRTGPSASPAGGPGGSTPASPGPSAGSGRAPGVNEAPEVIVLLTDGSNNTGPEPSAAAAQAADRGVRVYTIGYGTLQGGTIVDACVDPSTANLFPNLPSTSPQSRVGSLGGQRITSDSGIDEATLVAVAEATGGRYAKAESADELDHVLRDLPATAGSRREVVELSVAFVLLGAVLAGLGMVLSALWRPLP